MICRFLRFAICASTIRDCHVSPERDLDVISVRRCCVTAEKFGTVFRSGASSENPDPNGALPSQITDARTTWFRPLINAPAT